MSILPASLAAFSFAFSPLVWEYSIGAEVFALNNLLCSALVYLTILIIKQKDSGFSQSTVDAPFPVMKQNGLVASKLSKYPYNFSPRALFSGVNSLSAVGALIGGLAMANQHSSLIFLAVLVPAVLHTIISYNSTTTHRVGAVIICFFSFLSGLSPYGIFHLRALSPTPGTWGNLSTWGGLYSHFFR
jgi:hypothetical protein